MNTKELIKLVEKAFGTWEDEYCLSEETAKGMNEIIVILQRVKKFEKMFRDVENGSSLTWDIEREDFPKGKWIK